MADAALASSQRNHSDLLAADVSPIPEDRTRFLTESLETGNLNRT